MYAITSETHFVKGLANYIKYVLNTQYKNFVCLLMNESFIHKKQSTTSL